MGTAITVSSTTVELFFNQLYNALTRGTDQTDLVVASLDYYGFYETSQTSLKRYTTDASKAQSADGGFVSLKYKNADVVFDTATSGYSELSMRTSSTPTISRWCPSGRQHGDHAGDEERESGCDRDPDSVPGQPGSTNRSLQGVAKA
jgi:hypothetical protein